MSVRNSKAYCYYEWQGSRGRQHSINFSRISNLKNEKTYKGSVSLHVKKRIEQAVSLLLQKSEARIIINPITEQEELFRINFITLTISTTKKNYTASEAYKMLLKPFLQWLQKTKHVTDYIWKAELQKRGQIHYHITTNKWILWSEIKNKWNYLQRINGLLDDYYKKNNHYNPNSTDVHKVYKIKNIEAYLCKYLSKSEKDKGNTEGKIWDCSRSLKGKKYFTSILDAETEKNIYNYQLKNECRGWKNDYCDIIFFNEGYIKEVLTKSDYNQYKEYLKTLV